LLSIFGLLVLKIFSI